MPKGRISTRWTLLAICLGKREIRKERGEEGKKRKGIIMHIFFQIHGFRLFFILHHACAKWHIWKTYFTYRDRCLMYLFLFFLLIQLQQVWLGQSSHKAPCGYLRAAGSFLPWTDSLGWSRIETCGSYWLHVPLGSFMILVSHIAAGSWDSPDAINGSMSMWLR